MTRLSALVVAALAVSAHALPGANHLSDALDWSANKVSRIGSDDAHTATQWSFTDCGSSLLAGACSVGAS